MWDILVSSDHRDIAALTAAVKESSCEVNRRVNRSLSKIGYDIDHTPLTYSLAESKFDAAKALIECSRVDLEVEDSYGASPAYWAACLGHIPSLKALKERGDDLSRQCSNGFAPLHIALLRQKPKAARWLLEEGDADPHSKDVHDRTPLFSASENRLPDIAALLPTRRCAAVARPVFGVSGPQIRSLEWLVQLLPSIGALWRKD